MTQLNDLPTTELMQAGETFARLGLECPWVGENAWCNLEYLSILEVNRKGVVCHYEANPCPPAVAAAVVAFGLEVWKWCTGRGEYHWTIPLDLSASAALIVAVARAVEGE